MILNSYQIVYLITNLFNLYLIKKYLDVFFPLRKGQLLQTVIGYGIYFLITSITYLCFDIPLLNTLINIVLLIGITFFYDAGYKKKLWSVFVLYITYAFIEIAVTILTLHSGFNWFSSLGYSNIFWLFVIKILQFFAVLMIQNVVKIKSTGEVPFHFLLVSIFLPISSILMMIQITNIENIEARTIIFVILILLIINAMVFFLYDSFSLLYERQLKAAVIEQERQYYYHQCELMKETTEDVRDFRHDMNNHIMMMQELLDKNKVSDACDYVHSLSSRVKDIEMIYASTGNVVIDSIINYKLTNIAGVNWDIYVDATVPTELPVEIVDLSIILTNLLDNALRALKKIKDGKLIIRINYRKGLLFIIIQNSYDGDLQYENGELVTTKREEGHGRGLKLVEKAVEKYNGLLKITHDDKLFSAEALLYATKLIKK